MRLTLKNCPEELLDMIVGNLTGDRPGLYALMRTARFLRTLCEYHLYRKVEIIDTRPR